MVKEKIRSEDKAQLDSNINPGIKLHEDWAADPTFILHNIILLPECPDFPANQWLNIVKGQVINLAKVLGAHYTTELDNKQPQDLRELFQILVKVSKQSKAIYLHKD
ncbi:hypothetical protein JVU11DRAFT_438 [Chiua virens]|nr:hypothetical protein JVU11DRAFT_438 [Chiua virens]